MVHFYHKIYTESYQILMFPFATGNGL
jgi:hypothetical protein